MEIQIILRLTNGDEEFYVAFDNFTYSGDSYLGFEYRGIISEDVVEDYKNQKIGTILCNQGPFIGYVADSETPWIDLYTEKNGIYVGRIPYEIFNLWPATDRDSEWWTPGWEPEYMKYYYAEFGAFCWAAVHLGDTVLGSGRKNIATSTDGGKTWNCGSYMDDYGGNHVVGMYFVSENIAFMSFDPNNENYYGLPISRTIDGGKTWKRLVVSIPDSLKGKKLLPGTPIHEGNVIRYPIWQNPAHGVIEGETMYIVSHDNGMTWKWESQNDNNIIASSLSDFKNANPGNSFVYEGYTVEYECESPYGGKFDFHIHLPQLNSNALYAEKWNYIYQQYDVEFGDLLRKTVHGTNTDHYLNITYNTVTTGDVLTIYIIKSHGILASGAYTRDYDIFHYNMKTDRILSTNEFLAYYAEGQFADYTVTKIVEFMNQIHINADEMGNPLPLTEEDIIGVIPSVFGDGKFDVVYHGYSMEGYDATRLLFSAYPTYNHQYSYRLTYHDYLNCDEWKMYGQPAGYRLLLSQRKAGEFDAGYYVDCIFTEDIAEPPESYSLSEHGGYYTPVGEDPYGNMCIFIDHETASGHLNTVIPFDMPETAQDYYWGIHNKYFSYDRILNGTNYQVNQSIARQVGQVLDAYRNGKDPNELFPASKTEYTPYPLVTIRENPTHEEIGEILKNTSVGESGIINFSIDLGDGWSMALPMDIAGFGDGAQAYFTGVWFAHGTPMEQNNAEQNGQMDLQNLYQSILEDKTLVYSLSAEQGMYLSETFQSPDYKHHITHYSIMDLNNDGASELVCLTSFGYYTILHVEDNKIYAHSLPYRSFLELKEDGTFVWSGGAGDWGIGRIDFDKYSQTRENLAFCRYDYDSNTEVYSVGNREASKEEFDACYAAQGQKPDAVWYEWYAE